MNEEAYKFINMIPLQPSSIVWNMHEQQPPLIGWKSEPKDSWARSPSWWRLRAILEYVWQQ